MSLPFRAHDPDSALALAPFVAFSAAFFFANHIFWYFFAKKAFPRPRWDEKMWIDWSDNSTSLVHATVISVWSIFLTLSEPSIWTREYKSPNPLQQSWSLRLCAAFSCGYFIWDFLTGAYFVKRLGKLNLFHATYALSCYIIFVFPTWTFLAKVNNYTFLVTYFLFRILFSYWMGFDNYVSEAWAVVSQPWPQEPLVQLYGLVLFISTPMALGFNTYYFVLVVNALLLRKEKAQ